MAIDTNGGLPKDQKQSSVPEGGRQAGEPSQGDLSAPGGSSGPGGYGNAQNQANHQGQAGSPRPPAKDGQSRGERFDEAQGGGRGPESVRSQDADIAEDQAAHQERGQSVAAEESERG